MIELLPPSTRPRGQYSLHAEIGLRIGGVVPVDAAIVNQFGETGGHVDERIEILPAGFQQQDAMPRVGREPIGEHAAGRAGADDDVVVDAGSRHLHTVTHD